MTTPMCARYEEVSSAWMEVLGEFMQQAALEAYRVFGASGVEGLDESFAVGLTEMEFAESESVEELVVNEMFAGEEGQVGEEFEELRMEFLEEVWALVLAQGLG